MASAAGSSDGSDEIATVRIDLLDTDPPIWREVEVPTALTLKALHQVIQVEMGWFDQHLWEFTIDRQQYGPSLGGDWGLTPRRSADKVRLAEVLKPRRTRIDYLYDFGDSWDVRLTVSKVRAGDPALLYPRHVGGERNGPPEDCGGLPGFYYLLEALADPKHEEHAELSEWIGAYEPEAIDVELIEAGLKRLAKQRRTATARANRKAAD